MATAPSARDAEGRSARRPRTPLQPQRLARAMPMPLVLHSRWRALERRKRVGLHKQPFLPLTVTCPSVSQLLLLLFFARSAAALPTLHHCWPYCEGPRAH